MSIPAAILQPVLLEGLLLCVELLRCKEAGGFQPEMLGILLLQRLTIYIALSEDYAEWLRKPLF